MSGKVDKIMVEVSFTEDELNTLAEDILSSVDYDMYKEAISGGWDYLSDIKVQLEKFLEDKGMEAEYE